MSSLGHIPSTTALLQVLIGIGFISRIPKIKESTIKHLILLTRNIYGDMEAQGFEYTQYIQKIIDESIDSLNLWAGQLKIDYIQNHVFVINCNITDYAKSIFGLIPTE